MTFTISWNVKASEQSVHRWMSITRRRNLRCRLSTAAAA